MSSRQLRIDPASREVVADGSSIELTTMEYELLLLLASNPGRDFSRDDILAALRGIDAAILTRSVDILVSRLRAKLGDNSKPGRFIHTVWGRGYRFTGSRVEGYSRLESLSLRLLGIFHCWPVLLPGLIAGIRWAYPRMTCAR